MNHPIKEVMKKANVKQKDVCEKLDINQSTLSKRMNKEIQGSLEQSIEIAKEFNVKRFSIVREYYTLNVVMKNTQNND